MLGPAPQRRRGLDLLAAGAIVVVIAMVAAVVWWRSDARATTSITAAQPLPPLSPATALPEQLAPSWSAPSGATGKPVVVGGAVVTGDGAQVKGRDPLTGRVVWSYARDLRLCAVDAAFSRAVAVYRDSQGCSQVTSLEAATGERGPQRSSAADDMLALADDGTYLAAVGPTRLELWRSDLVRTLEYGRVDTPVAPDVQPRSGCTLASVASVPGRLSIVEACPGDNDDRLSLVDPAPADAAKPEEQASVLLPGRGARLLAVTQDAEAVLLPAGPDGPQVAVYDGTGAVTQQFAVPLSPADVAALGPSPVLEVDETPAVHAVVVGSTLLALDRDTLALRWSTKGVLGSGASVAGSLLVPTDGAVTALDATTGAVGRSVPVDRAGYRGRVDLAMAGDVVLEQRGTSVFALR